MDPVRSALFIPGNREQWLKEAHTHGADVILIDLEDAVPPGQKERARELTVKYAEYLNERDQRIHVRINGHPNESTDHTHKDIEALASTSVEALSIPMVQGPDELRQLDSVLTHIEQRDNLPPNSTELSISIETANGVRNAYEIATASERVTSIGLAAVKGGDTSRSLGYTWTGPGREGLETLYMRQKGVVDGRSAGVQIMGGVYVDVEDQEGLQADLQFAKEMGYTGYTVIHPSHVTPVNNTFTPSEEEITYWQGVLDALKQAEKEGKSAVRYEGDMIDIAHINTARRKLNQAKVYEDQLDVDIRIDEK